MLGVTRKAALRRLAAIAVALVALTALLAPRPALSQTPQTDSSLASVATVRVSLTKPDAQSTEVYIRHRTPPSAGQWATSTSQVTTGSSLDFSLGARGSTVAEPVVGWSIVAAGDAFPDDPDNPHFFHGANMWALFSIALALTVGGIFKKPFPALLAGAAPLAIGVALGEISAMLVFLIVVEGVAAVFVFMMMRR